MLAVRLQLLIVLALAVLATLVVYAVLVACHALNRGTLSALCAFGPLMTCVFGAQVMHESLWLAVAPLVAVMGGIVGWVRFPAVEASIEAGADIRRHQGRR